MKLQANQSLNILLVEEKNGDAFHIHRSLGKSPIPYDLSVVRNALEALQFLKHTATPRPHVVLLDLNLSTIAGHEVLACLKNDSHLQAIPVIILSSSELFEDIQKSYSIYTNCYIFKPSDRREYRDVVEAISTFWAIHVQLPANSFLSLNHST